MLTALLLAALALATEAPPPAEPFLAGPDPTVLLDMARARAAAGDEVGATDLAQVLLRSDAPEPVRLQAQTLVDHLGPGGTDWRAVAQLAGWQTAMGAWLGGPTVALSTRRWVHPSVNLGGMVLGGALGASTAVWYANRWELTPARATAIMASQQLGMLHGLTASLLVDQWQFGVPVGVAAGAVLGTAGGYLLASTDPDDGAMAAAYSGVLWGGYLGTLAFVVAGSTGWDPEDDREIAGLYNGFVDAGVLGFYMLAHTFDLSRGEVVMANVGGLLGFAAGGLFVLITAIGEVGWQVGSVALVLGASAVGGGIVSVNLVRGGGARTSDRAVAVGALVQGEGDQVRLGLPAPAVVPTAEGVRGAVSLVDYRF